MTDNDRDKNKDVLLREKIKQLTSISYDDFQTFTNHLKPSFSSPLTIDYIDKIKIGVIECVSKEDKHKWEIIHQFQSLHNGVRICGRFMKFLVINETDNTILGLIRFNLFRPRISLVDKMIGWSNETKYTQNMSQKVVNLQTLVPTQPFGYNCLGGKFLTLLSTSKEMLNLWEQKYGKIFSLVTMSLTGGVCQYSGLKTFQHIGNIIGESKIERGIYWCNLYENSLSLLRNETTVSNGELKSVTQITDEWKILSKKRMTSLIEQNRLSTESNTYDGYYVQ